MSLKQQIDIRTAPESPSSFSKPINEVDQTRGEQSLYDPLGTLGGSHTRSIQKDSGYYSQIRSKLKKLQMPLWNASATTWTRESSPSHRIPKAYRQTIGDVDPRRTTRWVLKVDTTRNISNPEKGQSFAKSTRIEHFYDKAKVDEPSAQSYHQHRYMDNSSYKMPLINNPEINTSEILKTLQSCILDSKLMDRNSKKSEPKTEISINKVMDSYLNAPTMQTQRRFDELKGRTFCKEQKPVNRYHDHAHRFAYDQSFTIEYPGVGSYNTSNEFAKNKPKYSIRKVLTRCFDVNPRQKSPGPSNYSPEGSRPGTTSTQGTFQNSLRVNLAKPLNETPGPAFYNPIQQTIERKCRPRDIWSSQQAARLSLQE